jgi:hypothetical protein
MSREFSPGERSENSPAVHCRVQVCCRISLEGTVEFVELIQPSLRDGTFLLRRPTLERVGYFQFSLREMADESTDLLAP